jgi:hypothetical protein
MAAISEPPGNQHAVRSGTAPQSATLKQPNKVAEVLAVHQTPQLGTMVEQQETQALRSNGEDSAGRNTTNLSSRGKEETCSTGAGELVFIGNDWPCALLPLILKHCVRHGSHMAGDAAFVKRLRLSLQSAHTAFCIHNLAYQGQMPLASFPRLCLPESALDALIWPPRPGMPQEAGPSTAPASTQGLAGDHTLSRASSSGEISEQHISLNWMHVGPAEPLQHFAAASFAP